MATKTKPTSRPVAPRFESGLPLGVGQPSSLTTAERLQRIEALGQRITGYIQFMLKIGNDTSAEAKDKAVVAFYEQMVLVERQLGRIQEQFQLE